MSTNVYTLVFKINFYLLIVDGSRLTRLCKILGKLAAVGHRFWCLAMCGMYTLVTDIFLSLLCKRTFLLDTRDFGPHKFVGGAYLATSCGGYRSAFGLAGVNDVGGTLPHIRRLCANVHKR